MLPRCTGRCGALAMRDPSAAKMAHEKSSRSLMLVDMDVCCSDLPIDSATAINLFEKRDSKTGSAVNAGMIRYDTM